MFQPFITGLLVFTSVDVESTLAVGRGRAQIGGGFAALALTDLGKREMDDATDDMPVLAGFILIRLAWFAPIGVGPGPVLGAALLRDVEGAGVARAAAGVGRAR